MEIMTEREKSDYFFKNNIFQMCPVVIETDAHCFPYVLANGFQDYKELVFPNSSTMLLFSIAGIFSLR